MARRNLKGGATSARSVEVSTIPMQVDLRVHDAVALRDCVELARKDQKFDPVVERRLSELLEFVERTSRWYEQMIAMPRSKLASLMKLGGGIARLIDRGGSKNRS